VIFAFDYSEPEPESVLAAPPTAPLPGLPVAVEGPPGNISQGFIVTCLDQERGPGHSPVKNLTISVDERSEPGGMNLLEWLKDGQDVAIKIMEPQETRSG
jgi:hypothetical protein